MFRDLETERLLLRGIAPDDAEFIFRQFSDPAVCKFLFDEEPFTQMEQAVGLIAFFREPEPRGQHRWILVRKSDGVALGTCGFHRWDSQADTADVGYDLREEHWGHGYMTEAMQAALVFARESMRLRAVNAVIYPGNARSVALAEKLGFRRSGETVEVFRGEDILHFVYTLEVQ